MITDEKEWLIRHLKRLLKYENEKPNATHDYTDRKELLKTTIKSLE